MSLRWERSRRLSITLIIEGLAPSYVIEGSPLYLAEVSLPDPTDRIIAQGEARVRAIEALGTIQPTGPFERVLAGRLVAQVK